ncbi:rhodanese-like domain-containing protein [Iamia majanohamensis]|uniref:Rhodanese-like domain-containing protein n=1 Tax=Iamia majanohamensis TaxID=467976 RepID=A0AAF0BUY9_9ACTN|nr:rhodanese-like domain-containing protein [Iamia majanohamensis]WCO66235.1 rhodanese-like domain-containing protein [Iamia majanohamensis]
MLLAVLAVVGLALVTACSDADEGSTGGATDTTTAAGAAPGQEAAEVALEEERTVIDVRTPEEYADGHVADARLIDVQDPSFDDAIAELPTDVEYVVYCRTGNRSAAAAERMREAGLEVLDGGGLPDMVDAGWPSTAG